MLKNGGNNAQKVSRKDLKHVGNGNYDTYVSVNICMYLCMFTCCITYVCM